MEKDNSVGTDAKNNNGQTQLHDGERSISVAVIKRLPRYYRYLRELLSHGNTRISSAELARLMNVTASQIRQDLNCFGGFGQQGYGYNVENLYTQICELLGVNDGFRAVIIGAGNLGRALVRSPMFERRGVTPIAMFDISPELIGSSADGIPIYDIDELEAFCTSEKVDIGVLTLPREYAPDALRRLEDAGVPGVWNFTSNELGLRHRTATVENVHLGDSLMTLCYRLRRRSNPDNANTVSDTDNEE